MMIAISTSIRVKPSSGAGFMRDNPAGTEALQRFGDIFPFYPGTETT
jgi:hypothetical protein